MDPNANLNEQIDIAQRMSEGKGRPGDPERLADLVLALDDWVRRGGFLPRRWEWWKGEGQKR